MEVTLRMKASDSREVCTWGLSAVCTILSEVSERLASGWTYREPLTNVSHTTPQPKNFLKVHSKEY